MAVAKTFSNSTKYIKAMWKIGLSATLIREDNQVVSLDTLIGPKLFEISWKSLINDGYLANIKCRQVNCIMSIPFSNAYKLKGLKDLKKPKITELRQDLVNFDVNKLMICLQLLQYHLSNNHKIIVFGDSKNGMEIYKSYFDIVFSNVDIPIINSDTAENDREYFISKFRESDSLNCIIFGRVGETGIDIPDANIIIQIDQQGSRRRQETQRVGRIMRISDKCDLNIFYTLVSVHNKNNLPCTNEYNEAKLRQTFLDQHGIQYDEHFVENGEIQLATLTNLIGKEYVNEKAYLKLENTKQLRRNDMTIIQLRAVFENNAILWNDSYLEIVEKEETEEEEMKEEEEIEEEEIEEEEMKEEEEIEEEEIEEEEMKEEDEMEEEKEMEEEEIKKIKKRKKGGNKNDEQSFSSVKKLKKLAPLHLHPSHEKKKNKKTAINPLKIEKYKHDKNEHRIQKFKNQLQYN